MTVSYSTNGGLVRELFRWKGSVFKALWLETLLWLLAWYIFQAVYIFVLDHRQKVLFASFSLKINSLVEDLPLQFLLGFFIDQIVTRWWEQFHTISWPESLMIQLNAHLSGPELRPVRRTIARWVNLTSTIVWRQQSKKIRKRFPEDEHLVAAGLMTREEQEIFNSYPSKFDRWWLPVLWMINLLRQCRDARVFHPSLYRFLIQEIQAWRAKFQKMLHYGWISSPLVYTQVATIATYGYFLLCIIGRQVIVHCVPETNDTTMFAYRWHNLSGTVTDLVCPEGKDYKVNAAFFPLVTLMQFVFFMGWLKVGEALIDPFGEDDEDFELNWVLDRNVQVCYMMIDDVCDQLPEDYVNYDPDPAMPLPYTKAVQSDVGYFDRQNEIKLAKGDHTLVWPETVRRRWHVLHVLRNWRTGAVQADSEPVRKSTIA